MYPSLHATVHICEDFFREMERIAECCEIDYVLVIFVSFNLINDSQEVPENIYSYLEKNACMYKRPEYLI